ncbi:helix-turn-helix domain-containing protein [Pseudoduganella sp. HUAS MS19]
MDSLITASARSLASGDVLGALKHVALREDPPALALRGIAMARLGDFPKARALLRRAARGFGSHEQLARARCVVAEAEVALAMRDFSGAPRVLAAALAVLEAHGDYGNALQARLIAARKLLLLGRLEAAAAELSRLDIRALTPALAAVAQLAAAELAMRSLRPAPARSALAHAHAAATRSGVPELLAEVMEARAALQRPAARRHMPGGMAPESMSLDAVAALLASDTLVLDACRRGLGRGAMWRPLARRPVLFALARTLAEAWPGDAGRELLIERAFNTRRPDETHRARLRVEIGRLRALLKGLAVIEASPSGFAMRTRDGGALAVLEPPIDGAQASLLALLSDGAAWSTSALAQALDASQRTIQRALAELETAGRVRSIGNARTRRWLAPPLAGFTTILLLPAALPLE